MHYAKTAQKLREQIVRFSGELSSGLPKPARRFIAEMIYGIQARQSVRLTEIGRALEERVPLRKTEYRLCRQLKRAGLWERLTRALCRMAASQIREMTLLILDLTDISKKYARRMEYLGGVHDGSEDAVRNGYWMVQVVGAEPGKATVMPLYNRLYSPRYPGYRSENEEIEGAIEMVSSQTGGRGVWVMDRGGDREKLLWYLAKNRHRFLVRLRGDRHLIFHGRAIAAGELARTCPMLYAETVVRGERDQ